MPPAAGSGSRWSAPGAGKGIKLGPRTSDFILKARAVKARCAASVASRARKCRRECLKRPWRGGVSEGMGGGKSLSPRWSVSFCSRAFRTRPAWQRRRKPLGGSRKERRCRITLPLRPEDRKRLSPFAAFCAGRIPGAPSTSLAS